MADDFASEAPQIDPKPVAEDITEPTPAVDATIDEATEIQAPADSVEVKEDSVKEVATTAGVVDVDSIEIQTESDVPLAVQIALSVIPATEAHPDLPL